MKRKDVLTICENIILRYHPHRNFTSIDVLYDAGLNTPEDEYDHIVYSCVSEIRRSNRLKKYGKQIDVIGYSPKYGRNQKRPTNLLRVKSIHE